MQSKRDVPCRGLNRSLPYSGDLAPVSTGLAELRVEGQIRRGSDVLERYPVLRYMLEARLPDKSNIAGIRRLESPRQEGGDWIAPDCDNAH